MLRVVEVQQENDGRPTKLYLNEGFKPCTQNSRVLTASWLTSSMHMTDEAAVPGLAPHADLLEQRHHQRSPVPRRTLQLTTQALRKYTADHASLMLKTPAAVLLALDQIGTKSHWQGVLWEATSGPSEPFSM